MTTRYFAYGSNLSRARVAKRLGFSPRSERAVLPGYRLVFNKASTTHTVAANIVEDPNSQVWGAVYEIAGADLEKLDVCEGVADRHYHRSDIEVTLDSGSKVGAVTYVAGADFIRAPGKPSSEYAGYIETGAEEHQLPPDYISQTARLMQGGGGAV